MAILIFLLSLSGCAGPFVKTDLQTFQQYPEQFKGKRVILTASLEQVMAHPDAYVGKKVELTGPVISKGFWGPPDWDFLLTDGKDRTIRCYEHTYRVDAWILPVMAIKRAARQNEMVTVVGKLQRNLEVELDWIEYEGQHFDTDYLPSAIPYPFM